MSGLSLATDNLRAAIGLLLQLQQLGLQHVVLCPGSRSAPLALAAGGLAERGLLDLVTAIDERSAGFHALGVAVASGRPVAVITTSGTAVANLLPAAVEADRSSIPLLFLTGDRPQRLKNCGANQTVNQEDFLASACRWMASGPVDGLHGLPAEALRSLTAQAWERSLQPPVLCISIFLLRSRCIRVQSSSSSSGRAWRCQAMPGCPCLARPTAHCALTS